MSISIGIGDLALFLAEETDPDEIDEYLHCWYELSRFLAGRGYPGYEEPRTLPQRLERSTMQSFPARYLHLLRRAYVYHRNGLPVEPLSGEHVTGDPVLRAEYDQPRLTSHLVHHADGAGFYVPLDFPAPLVAGPGESVLGATVGSTHQLRRELCDLAPALDIVLSDGELDDAHAAELANSAMQVETHRLGTERAVWFVMFEAATQSIALHSAIRVG